MYFLRWILINHIATTYDPSVASAINSEFRELLTMELEKVDDRFFEVHDLAEEELDELDATVRPNETPTNEVAQWAYSRRAR